MSETVHISAIVPSPHRDALLLASASTEDAVLPSVVVSAEDSLEQQLDALAEQCEVTSPFLRWAADTGRDDTMRRMLAEFEPMSAADRSWLPLQKLDQLTEVAHFRDPLSRWAGEQQGDSVASLRPAWARPGWHTAASTWIAEQLAARGVETAGAATPVQQWAISAVLRQPSDAGDFYLKAVFGSPGRAFWHEPRLTAALSHAHPELVPETVATDDARGLLLMADMGLAGGRPGDVAARTAIVQALARIQIHWSDRHDELLALGCPDRRLSTLATDVAEAFADGLSSSGLGDAEKRRVEKLLPRVAQLGEQVAEWPIPTSLVHGDFHPGNAGVRADGTACLFDWSDGALSHPLLDVCHFTTRLPAAEKAKLWDVYCSEWGDVASPQRLRRVAAQATALSAVYQVVTHHGILRNLAPEDRFPFSGDSEFCWRRALSVWDELDDAVV